MSAAHRRQAAVAVLGAAMLTGCHQPAPPPMPRATWDGRVLAVVDGDTLHALLGPAPHARDAQELVGEVWAVMVRVREVPVVQKPSFLLPPQPEQ